MSQPDFRCDGCGEIVTSYNCAAWNAGLCDRCQPANDNPELARLERMNAAAAEPLAVECVWCQPPHLITPGRLPATSGLCETALKKEMATLDARQGAA